MLIDATHPEETRVVVVDGTKLEEFDFESTSKAQLKGNIYLAKVARVEPSLQAAFVEYGGNRHGFLAFNEIHPDYYQIPVADREALIEQQKQQAAAEEAESQGRVGEVAADGEEGLRAAEDSVETVSGEEEEEISRRPVVVPRYRVQEVIKRRQILLVQVTKEERGTKGAALTSYISLAGRFCVLMPNTTRGGGISRKIQSGEVRKWLRSVVTSLKVPEGMAVILRTAGQGHTKAEIKRDYDYLIRLWDEIRRITLESTAPSLVHEEANLIKRSIRDLYSSKIEEIQVEGEDGYRAAKEFMRTLMPSHAKKVQPYRDRLPVFTRYQVDSQLDTIHSPTVQLRSGGYIVINPTEALVAIDVNSGRSTRERNIEETATATNLEAADEIARQLRQRDLAGLIVLDFIDMEENRNIRAVEKRLKEAVHSDRARIQMGRISSFGLLELSRQRLRPSLLEVSSKDCPYCAGSGHVRSVESSALHALRVIEEEGVRERAAEITATMPSPVAYYLLNNKRPALAEIEARYDFKIRIVTDDRPQPPDCAIEVIEARKEPRALAEAPAKAAEQPAEGRKRRGRRRRRGEKEDEAQPVEAVRVDGAEAAEAEEGGEAEKLEAEAEEGEAEPARRRRRGRRGGRRRARARTAAEAAEETTPEAAEETTPEAAEETTPEAAEETTPEAAEETRRTRKAATTAEAEPSVAPEDAEAAAEAAAKSDGEAAAKPAARRTRRRRAGGTARKTPEAEPAGKAAAAAEPPEGDGHAGGEAAATDLEGEGVTAVEEKPEKGEVAEPPSPPRRGWWQRFTGE
jgi:ribonuclease E